MTKFPAYTAVFPAVNSSAWQSGKLLFVERTLALPSGEGGRAPARSGEVSSVKAYQQPTFDTPSAPVCATSAAPPEGEPRVLCKQQFADQKDLWKGKRCSIHIDRKNS